MGDRSKGSDAGNVKKPKAAKAGNRPHEQRQRDEALTKATTDPAKAPPAKRN